MHQHALFFLCVCVLKCVGIKMFHVICDIIQLFNAESLQCTHTLTNDSVTEANLPCTCIRFLGGRKVERMAKTKQDKSRDHKNILLAACKRK